MKKLLFTTAALLFACVNANADTYTYTVTGHAIDGTDLTGIFGTAGAQLAGSAYVATYTFDPLNPGSTHNIAPLYQDVYGGTFNLPQTISPVTATLTINGITYTFNTPFYSYAEIQYHQMDANVHASFDSNNTFMDFDLVDDSILFPTTFQEFNYPGAGTSQYSRFRIDGGSTLVNLAIENVTLSGGVAPVPGPIVGAGLPGLLRMLGLGGWKFWRRRKVA